MLGEQQFWQIKEELKLLRIEPSQDLGIDVPDPLQATWRLREEAGPSNGAADHLVSGMSPPLKSKKLLLCREVGTKDRPSGSWKSNEVIYVPY